MKARFIFAIFLVTSLTACLFKTPDTITSNTTTASCVNFKADSIHICDSRDGKIYRTVKIGHLRWMAQNLNYGSILDSSHTQGNKYCYLDSTFYCDTLGGLYTWSMAMNLSRICDTSTCANVSDSIPIQGICPLGWHLPSDSEFQLLIANTSGDSIGGPQLRSLTWNGNDSLGFSALPGGNINKSISVAFGAGAYFWSTTSTTDLQAWYISVSTGQTNIQHNKFARSLAFSIRCIKDTLE